MLENITALELLEVMSQKEVLRLWKGSIENESGILFSAATKVLAKKGKYEIMQYFILNKLLNNELKLRHGSEFTNIFAQTLYELRNSAMLLGKLGRQIQVTAFEDRDFGRDELKTFLDKNSDCVYTIDKKDLDEMLNSREITMHDYLKNIEKWSSVMLVAKRAEFEDSIATVGKDRVTGNKGNESDLDSLYNYLKSLSRHDFKSMKSDTRKKIAEMLLK